MPRSPERSPEHELALRIVVVQPPPGVAFGVQVGRDELLPPTRAHADRLSFDVRVRVAPVDAGGFTLRGAVAQGPPQTRFVYVTSGVRAGQPNSPWDRRAKVPLTGITRALVDAALASGDAVLEARIQGTGRDGGPACASVPLLDGGWRLAQASE